MSIKPLRDGDALLLVDLQRDFLPGGALAVRGGDRVIPVANRCIDAFVARGLPVFASRDWHPGAHASFRDRGGPWPPHCVAGSTGAGFAEGLRLPPGARIVSKATQPTVDAYSAFQGTGLADALNSAHVQRIVVAGLATDYCVLHSVLDALALGLQVLVVRDGIAAVDAEPGDGEQAIETMRSQGADFASSAELVARRRTAAA